MLLIPFQKKSREKFAAIVKQIPILSNHIKYAIKTTLEVRHIFETQLSLSDQQIIFSQNNVIYIYFI